MLEKIDAGELKKLFPLGNFPLAELEVLAEKIVLLEGGKGKVLVQAGDDDGQALYLLTGKLQVTDEQGNVDVIKTGSSQTHFPVSYGHPHSVTIQCMEPSTYFRLDRQIVENLLQANRELSRVSLEELTSGSDYLDTELYRELLCAYYTDKLFLPALPNVAMQIQDILQAADDNSVVASILQLDMSTAALIIRSANSPLFRGKDKIETIEQAIARLGFDVVKHLVLRFSEAHTFEAKHKGIALRCNQLWIHSAEVAAFAYVLAQSTQHLDPEHAMTLGLVHDIGALPVLYFADRHPDLAWGSSNIDNCLEALRGPFGAAIVDKWGLSDDYVNVAMGADNWSRREDGVSDYIDLIKIAQLYSFMGKSKEQVAMRGISSIPAYDTVPAFSKMGFDVSDQHRNREIIDEARRRMEKFREIIWVA